MSGADGGAEVVVLGSAQDGGVPHAGCLCPRCEAARANHRLRRLPASIGLRAGDEWLIVDATDAFEEQMHMLWSRRPASRGHAGERYRPPETVILTHAHTGHYVGIWQLDRSVLAAPGTRVLAPPRTAAFLAANEPWAGMAAEGFIRIEALEWGRSLPFAGGVEIEPLEVPHRTETAAPDSSPTDTTALLLRGPRYSLLYLPDIDFWEQWERDVAEVVASVDVALLDGTFWQSPTSRDVPHPPIVQTMGRLEHLVGQTRIVFTHLNHTNPALTAGSPEATELARRGFEIAREGMRFDI